MKSKKIYLSFFLSIFAYEREKSNTELFYDLMQGYDKNIRPFYLQKPVKVSIDIFMNSFGSIKADDMSYAVNLNLRQRWNDPRLDFSKLIRDKRESIPIDASLLDRLWMPDLIFTNEKSSRFHNVTTENKLMRLSKNGDVYTSTRISVVMASMMSLENFPMDSQTLYMQLECFTRPDKDIQLVWSPQNPFQFNANLSLPDFDFDTKKITLTRCDKSYETGTYSCIEAKFPLKRLLGYYIIGLYVPTGLAVVLSYLSFWIDPKNAPARICIGIFANLTVNKMVVADKNLPAVSYIKALDIWLFACQLLTFVALVEYAVVNVQLRMEVEDRAKAKKLQEEADERCQQEAEEEEQGLDDTTLWLMDMVGVRPESTRRKATPIVFKITDAENIDRKFRKIFPAACGLFNIIYWGYCFNRD